MNKSDIRRQQRRKTIEVEEFRIKNQFLDSA